MTVTREQALAFRIAAQGLGRRSDDDLEPVLALGLQHHGWSADLALAARLAAMLTLNVTNAGGTTPSDAAARVPDGASTSPAARGLEPAWSHRGAPHWHPPGTAVARSDELRPLDDADAARRLGWSGPDAARIGIPALEAIDRTAAALAAVVTTPLTKGEVSGAVTRLLPEPLLRDCPGCGVRHVHEQLMRLASPAAGLALDVSGRTLRLRPAPPGWRRPDCPGDPAAAARVVTAAVRVVGPVTTADLAAWVGTGPAAWRPAIEAAREELVEVEVVGSRPAWVRAADRDALADPPRPPRLRLLPPFDPLLGARDRDLLVPDRRRHREVWSALGHPGVVLADGEVAGTWRQSASGTRLTLVVRADGPLDAAARAALDDEAQRVAAARGLRLVGLSVE